MNRYNGKTWDNLNKAEKQLYRVNENVTDMDRCRMRYTLRSVPTLIIDEYFSVVYFMKTKSFRVFTGFMDFETKSEHIDFKTYIEVAEFLNMCKSQVDCLTEKVRNAK